jgi:catechol 2,3-dioxygenase-like lactoylglutathione lyase family enzyme
MTNIPANIPFEQFVTFLYTSDLAATGQYYEQLLGLPLVLDQGTCRIYRVSPGGFLGFCTRLSTTGSEAAPPAAQVVITLATSDVDGWYTRLKTRGVHFEKPPTHHQAFNIYHAFLRDPNGYLLEIQQFLDPAWPQ